MRERAASRPASERAILRVLFAVFALAVCALACAHATPLASSQMSAAMTTQVSITGTEPLITMKAWTTAAADSASRPGPSMPVPSTGGQRLRLLYRELPPRRRLLRPRAACHRGRARASERHARQRHPLLHEDQRRRTGPSHPVPDRTEPAADLETSGLSPGGTLPRPGAEF
jgi:hypothetical protein